MTAPIDEQSSIGLALEWVSRILAVTLIMILPGLGGQWLDQRLGTGFLGLLGFAFGVTVGIWYLVAMTSRSNPKSRADETFPRKDAP